MIVKKYENYPIEHFRNLFKKVREQLEEIDEGQEEQSETKVAEGAAIDADQEEEVDEEQKRQASLANQKKAPVIHNIEVDEKTGSLSIQQDNIEDITVKYYLIDAEILFSRSPFVKDQAEQFSYVKPFHVFSQATEPTGNTVIALPSELKGKNVVIEINSTDIQKFKTFYSSELDVHINDNFGELKVHHRESMQPLSKVYVKVFCKDTSGSELFYRDGFTDIRGKFEYANSSGRSLANVKKFAILVSDDHHGSTIKEVEKPRGLEKE